GDTICDIELGNNPSEGVPLRVVDPKNTSRECPKCQYVNKKNRNKNQFECLQCEYKDMADYVALPLALLGLRSNSLL
ncbi:MAG: zinc ribbon domain-containing protein, partial [Candidatus Nitrosopolaris sp.]